MYLVAIGMFLYVTLDVDYGSGRDDPLRTRPVLSRSS